MPLRKFLINRSENTKFRLDGIIQSTHLPTKAWFHHAFGHHLIYSPDELPPKTDLRANMTTVEDQSSIGSCSANCLAGAYEYLTKKENGVDVDISRLFIYYNGRAKEGKEPHMTDSGCAMTDAIEAIKEFGTCRETIWPYDIAKVNTRPSNEAYQKAKDHKITQALKVNIDLQEMKSSLAQGFPFAFGLRLYGSFDKASKTGVVPMPSESDRVRQSHGSHALLAVGYSDQSQAFIVRNSWGERWGDKGYCYIPYDYLANKDYCFDAWTIRKVESHDLGQAHWDQDDSIDYMQNQNDDGDHDDHHAIEHHEHPH